MPTKKPSSSGCPSHLVFLEVTHPTVPKGRDEQRVIRSHVTWQQHRKRREIHSEKQTDLATLQNEKLEIATGNPSPTIPATDRGTGSLSELPSSENEISTAGLAFLNSAHPSQTKALASRRLVRSHVTKWQHRRRRVQAAELSKESGMTPKFSRGTPALESVVPKPPSSPAEQLISKGAAAIRAVILQDANNVVATCINKLGIDLRSIMVRSILHSCNWG